MASSAPIRGPREVRLVMTASTFGLRLRLNLALLRGRIGWLVAGGFVLPTLGLLVTFMGDGWPFELGRAEVFVLAVAANVGLFVGVSLFSTALRSILPPAQERFLPQAVTFYYNGVRVEPRGGDAFEDSYGFVLSVTRTAQGLDLKIGQKPLLVVHVTPAMIGAEPFEQLEIWLARNRKLPT